MPRAHGITVAATLACAAVTYPWSAAEACSVDTCWRVGYFVPDEEAAVPANTPGLYWRPMTDPSSAPDPDNVELVAVERPDEPIPFEPIELDNGEYVLALEADLEEDTAYRLVDVSECDGGGRVGPEVSFVASAPAALPERLGELVATAEGVGDLQVAAGASCDATLEADRISLALAPSAEAEPWLDLLHFETLVNGEVWTASADGRETNPPGASWVGRGKDRLYALCEEHGGAREGLAEGHFEVIMRATLPGTERSFETQPVAIELDCAGGGSVAPGGGCAVGRGGSPPPIAPVIALLLGAGLIRRRGGSMHAKETDASRPLPPEAQGQRR